MAKRGPKPKCLETRGRKRRSRDYRSDNADRWIEEVAEAYVSEFGLSVRRAARLAAQHHLTGQFQIYRTYEKVRLDGASIPEARQSQKTRAMQLAIVRHVVRTSRFGQHDEKAIGQQHPSFVEELPPPTSIWVDARDHVAQRIAQRIYRKNQSKT